MFIPPVTYQHVIPSVAVDVSDTHSMLVSRLADDFLLKGITGLFPVTISVVGESPEGQRVLGVPAIDDPVWDSIFVDVVHQLGFVLRSLGVDKQMSFPGMA